MGGGIDESATACGQDVRRLAKEARDDLALAIAKRRLTIALEYVGDRAAGSRLDFGVGIAKCYAEAGGQTSADRAFARAHHAYQCNRSVQFHALRLHAPLRPRQRDLRERLHFRHKRDGECVMRTRNSEAMGWGSWVALGIGAVVVVAVIGLSVYGGRVTPVQHPVEQIIPNDRLPN